MPMNNAKAGVSYFAMIFALGFVLGTVRVLVIIPYIGEWYATLLELPVILTASWFVSGWLINRMQIAPDNASRLMMGLIAFSLLVLADLMLGLAFGRSLGEQASAITQPAGLLGLAGQVVFGLLPWIRAFPSLMEHQAVKDNATKQRLRAKCRF
jgi:hypothetical protein